jgi:hypothetical protein
VKRCWRELLVQRLNADAYSLEFGLQGEDTRAMQRFFCKIGVHRWRRQRNPESGEAYLECLRCQKQKDTMTLIDFSDPGGAG